MAFPVVTSVLSVNLSLDDVYFSDVIEQKLFFNQPVEVRVWCEGLEYQLGKFSGGVKSLLSLLSPKGLDSYSPLTARCRLRKTMLVCLALDIILNMLLSCDKLYCRLF